MRRTDTIIIGGGQAGLAMSRCLSDRAIDHVVLERGRVAERWRSERWDSLRLLTPNWQSRLPGFRYQERDQDGYMSMPEVIDYFTRYARSFSAPIQAGTTVVSVEREGAGFRVTTDRGAFSAPNVVIATGYCDVPKIPELAKSLSKDFLQLVPTRYRNPDALPDGGVLVVGASASGIQIADELKRSGRAVTLAVGRHTRLPRRYRGKDIKWWLDAMGIVNDTAADVYDIEASRRQPSLQLVGRDETLDLAVLQNRGVRLVGRALTADRTKITFAEDLGETISSADKKLKRLLARIDGYIDSTGMARELIEAEALDPIPPSTAPSEIDLRAEGVSTIVWATGFRRSYPWLKIPVLGGKGEVRHKGGITPVPGLYILGLRFLRRRNSSFIDGVGKDAAALAEHIACRLDRGRDQVA